MLAILRLQVAVVCLCLGACLALLGAGLFGSLLASCRCLLLASRASTLESRCFTASAAALVLPRQAAYCRLHKLGSELGIEFGARSHLSSLICDGSHFTEPNCGEFSVDGRRGVVCHILSKSMICHGHRFTIWFARFLSPVAQILHQQQGPSDVLMTDQDGAREI